MRLDHLGQVARVAIVAPSGVRLASVGALVDCFDRARAWVRRQYGAIDILPTADRFDLVDMRVLTSAAGRSATEGGTTVQADPLDGGDYDVVVVADHAYGVVRREERARLTEWLRRHAAAGATIAACGASVALLAGAGLLDGRAATGPWLMADYLRGTWPDVRFDFDVAMAEDGAFLTTVGVTADFDLAVRLVGAVASPNLGLWLRRVLSRADAVVGVAETDPLLTRAQYWLAGRLSQPVRIDELAAAMQVSRRTLHRHFVEGTGETPIGYLQGLRIQAAMQMLERTGFSVERIAALVGYTDTAFFRQAFRRRTGSTPRRWRIEHRRTSEPQ